MICTMMTERCIKIHKLSTKLGLLSIILLVSLLCASCGNSKVQLSAPDNVTISEQEILSWDKVEHATGYKVVVGNSKEDIAEIDTKDNHVDLFRYFYNPYEFKVLVYAYDETRKYRDSSPSDVLTHKIEDNMTLFKVRAINNNTEYEIACSNSEKLSGKVLIPMRFNDLPVTKIAQSGFENCKNITGVIIPSSITVIGGSAFRSCKSLVKVSVPNSVTELGTDIFGDCISLKEVKIPDSVVKIRNPFINCVSLESIYIPSCVSSIDSTAFSGCDNLTDITVDENNPAYKVDSGCIIAKEDNTLVVGTNYSVIPSYVTKIEDWAFYLCRKIERMVVPGNVKEVGSLAFMRCSNLKEIIFEEGVEIIGASADGWNSIEKISIPHSAKLMGVYAAATYEFPNGNDRYIVDGNCLLDLQESRLLKALDENPAIPSYIKKIGIGAFSKWKGEYVYLPEGIETIEEEAFTESNIKRIEIPVTVKTIDSSAFENCKDLETVVFNEGLEFIGIDAFRECHRLTQVELPKSLKIIGDSAFYSAYCVVLLPGPLEYAGEYCFDGCMVFTDIDTRELTAENKYDISNIHTNSTCVHLADFEDGYVKSFQYLNYMAQVGDFIINYKSISGWLFSFVPCREGYKFLGWTTDPETNEIVIEPVYYDSIDYYIKYLDGPSKHIHLDIPNYQWYTENMEKDLESGTVFYSVWEKLE